MNKITLIGNNSADIELKTTASGKTVCNFNLAVARKYDRDTTDWFKCTAWEKLAETIAKYVKKGNKVCVIGRIEFEQDKDDKTKRHHNIIIEDIEMLTPKNKEQDNKYVEVDKEEDLLPF